MWTSQVHAQSLHENLKACFGCDMYVEVPSNEQASSLTRVRLLPEGVEDPVPLGLLAVDGGDVDEAFGGTIH